MIRERLLEIGRRYGINQATVVADLQPPMPLWKPGAVQQAENMTPPPGVTFEPGQRDEIAGNLVVQSNK